MSCACKTLKKANENNKFSFANKTKRVVWKYFFNSFKSFVLTILLKFITSIFIILFVPILMLIFMFKLWFTDSIVFNLNGKFGEFLKEMFEK